MASLPDDLEHALAAREPKRQRAMRACAVCGQSFDLGDLAQTFHHNDEPHAPLPSPGD
mgnify:CR=1 FL=1